MLSVIVVINLLIFSAQLFGKGASSSRPEWDQLSVTFGKFSKLPKTEIGIKSAGWIQNADGCKNDLLGYYGKRYVLNGDMGTMLLFDKNGEVAGIQMAIPRTINIATGHQNAFLVEGENYLLTAYFTEPSTICSGTSKVKDGYVGDKLVLMMKKGQTVIPLKEKKIKDTEWTKGRCFPAMGNHYWYNIRKDMNCMDFAPFFILYDGGELNGFGFATFGNVEHVKNDRLEHPIGPQAAYFMKPETAPTCIMSKKDLTVLHVYLKSNPQLVQCPK